jgi:superfamily II DNA or RNA helicase
VVTTLTSFRKEYENFVGFDNLIVDESDLALTDKMIKAIILFKSTRKWAFTGTIKSAYDDCNKQYAPVLAEFWGAHVVHKSTKSIPLKGVYSFEYKKVYEGKFPHKDWQKFREALDEDIERKKAQLAYIIENASPDGYSLCLFDRVADVEAFYRAFKKRGYVVYMSTGEMNKADREQHLGDFKKTGGYLLGVSSTLNRGYDNTLLTKAFVMYPVKGENSLRQTIGRVMRHFEGKESFLYLWADSMLNFQLEQQKKIIKKYFNLVVTQL